MDDGSDAPAGSTAPELSQDERRLLTLLAAGHTDDAAGSRLGLSRRTVERRLQGAMAALGARSRIELGYRLGSTRVLDESAVDSLREAPH